MAFLSQALGWMGELALVVLVARAFPSGLVRVYGYFYVYLSAVLCQDVFLRSVRPGISEGQYAVAYWVAEFITAVIGFGVIWEIYRQALAPYAGVRVMTRTVMAVILSAILFKAGSELRLGPVKRLMPTTREVEINLRVVQVVLLIALLALIFYYSIPLGRNVRFLLAGYAAYVASDLVTMTLVGNQFTIWLGAGYVEMSRTVLVQLEYCVTLLIWCIGMWSTYSEPIAVTALEADYERLSRQTARAVSRIRDHIMSGWR